MSITKTTLKAAIVVLLIPAFLMGCKKDKKTTPEQEVFAKEILNIVPKATIDTLRSWGMVINEGKTPPNLAGAYYTNTTNCFFDNSDAIRLGRWRGNYTYRFYDQNNEKLTINIDYNIDGNTDVAKGVGSFISGSGDKFSAFFVTEGVSLEIKYKTLTIISGTKTADGIVDWTDMLRMTQKDSDPKKRLIGVGGTRIFKEEDKLASVRVTADDKRTFSIEHIKANMAGVAK